MREHDEVMTTSQDIYTVAKGHGGRFACPALGEWKQRKWYSYDADAVLASGHLLTFRRTNWNRVHLAEVPTSRGAVHTIGEFDKTSWLRDSGTVSWEGVDYDFGTKSGWKGTFALSRHGVELAELKVTGWKQDIEITLPEAGTAATASSSRPPAGLLLFCAWIALITIRDRTAATA